MVGQPSPASCDVAFDGSRWHLYSPGTLQEAEGSPFTDDPGGTLQLAHAVRRAVTGDARTFIDCYRDPAEKELLRSFFEEELASIKGDGPTRRREITKDAVVAWLDRRS